MWRFKGGRDLVQLGRVSEALSVPLHIRRPPYVGSSPPPMESQWIAPKSARELRHMRDACARAATALRYAGSLVKPGVTTDELDRKVHQFIVDMNCYPSPLGYSGFPKSICTSINEVLCHGIPDDRPLQEGETLNIDVSLYTKEGVHGDCSDMYVVGKCDEGAKKLIDVTRRALDAAIEACGPEVPFAQIGETITSYVKEHSKFSIVDEFTGHGIGEHFHMMPYIIHTPNDFPGVMKVGHTFTIEPVVVEGAPKFRILQDNWTAVSNDRGRGAQVEHTVLITSNGAEVLTLWANHQQ